MNMSNMSIEQLADPDSHFADINGLRVHYKVMGQGDPPLVLLHGSFLSLFSWREVMRPLSDLGTVIAFDRPAFGLTSRTVPTNSARTPYSPEAQADMVVALLDELGHESAVLVGNSTGGTIALLAALRHPERVRALVLVGAMVYSGYAVSEFPPWMRPLLPALRLPGTAMVRTMIRLLQDKLTRSFWHNKDRVPPEVLATYRQHLRVDGWGRALWHLTMATHALHFEPQLAQVHMPVLVVSGEQDRTVKTDESVRLSQALPHASLVLLPDCGHLPQEESPQAFVEAVHAFVRQLPGDSADAAD
jgi:pimeloyl-ACP methyl ester carboxylesterase